MNTAGTYFRRCASLYRGIVEDNIDPEDLGRCKVRVPSVHGELNYPASILPWARPIVSSPVSDNRGSVNIPDIGTIVWVLFEGASKDFPVYFGGTYAKGDIPVDKDIVDFYIEDNTKISYNRKEKLYTIAIGDSKINLSPESIEVVGDLSIEGSLHVSKDLSVKGTATIKTLVVTDSLIQREGE